MTLRRFFFFSTVTGALLLSFRRLLKVFNLASKTHGWAAQPDDNPAESLTSGSPSSSLGLITAAGCHLSAGQIKRSLSHTHTCVPESHLSA